MGLDGAREEAQRLLAKALEALEPYGEKADVLRSIAHFIVDRKN